MGEAAGEVASEVTGRRRRLLVHLRGSQHSGSRDVAEPAPLGAANAPKMSALLPCCPSLSCMLTAVSLRGPDLLPSHVPCLCRIGTHITGSSCHQSSTSSCRCSAIQLLISLPVRPHHSVQSVYFLLRRFPSCAGGQSASVRRRATTPAAQSRQGRGKCSSIEKC